MSCTQYSTIPIEYSHSSSGSRLRSTVGTRMRDPAITSAYSSIAAFRVGEDSLLNGLSGLAGSAACLYSLAANA